VHDVEEGAHRGLGLAGGSVSYFPHVVEMSQGAERLSLPLGPRAGMSRWLLAEAVEVAEGIWGLCKGFCFYCGAVLQSRNRS